MKSVVPAVRERKLKNVFLCVQGFSLTPKEQLKRSGKSLIFYFLIEIYFDDVHCTNLIIEYPLDAYLCGFMADWSKKNL